MGRAVKQGASNCSCGDACTLASRRIFRVERMDCAHESTPILSALSAVPGVGRAVPSYADSTLAVEFDPHAVSPERIVQAISEAGFRADIDERTAEEMSFWERHGRLVASSASGILLAAGLSLKFMEIRLPAAMLFLLLATVSGGWYVSRRAWQALRHRQLEMNTLMATAAVGALLIGEWAEAGATMFLFSLAQVLEARSMDRARHAIRASSTFPRRRPPSAGKEEKSGSPSSGSRSGMSSSFVRGNGSRWTGSSCKGPPRSTRRRSRGNRFRWRRRPAPACLRVA